MSTGKGGASVWTLGPPPPLSFKWQNFDLQYSVILSTKYIGGHSDIIAGAITAATPELAKKIHEMQKFLGGCLVSDFISIAICTTMMHSD